MIVWVLTGHSESGDDYGPCVYSEQPDAEEISRWAHACDGNEEHLGCGYDGSWVHVETHECVVDDPNSCLRYDSIT